MCGTFSACDMKLSPRLRSRQSGLSVTGADGAAGGDAQAHLRGAGGSGRARSWSHAAAACDCGGGAGTAPWCHRPAVRHLPAQVLLTSCAAAFAATALTLCHGTASLQSGCRVRYRWLFRSLSLWKRTTACGRGCSDGASPRRDRPAVRRLAADMPHKGAYLTRCVHHASSSAVSVNAAMAPHDVICAATSI